MTECICCIGITTSIVVAHYVVLYDSIGVACGVECVDCRWR